MSKIGPISIAFELFAIVFGILGKSVAVVTLGVLLLGLTLAIMKKQS